MPVSITDIVSIVSCIAAVLILLLHLKDLLILKILNKLLLLNVMVYIDIVGSPKLNHIREYLVNCTDQQIVFFKHNKIGIFRLFYIQIKMSLFNLVFRNQTTVAEEEIREFHFANLAKLVSSNEFPAQVHEKIHLLSRLSIYSYGYLFLQERVRND